MNSMLGRFINDSVKPNLKIEKVMVDGKVHLFLYSLVDILAGTELRYNYDAPNLWWRREVPIFKLFFNYRKN